MYLPTQQRFSNPGLSEIEEPTRPDEIDVEFLDSPEIIDLMTQREMGLQGLGNLDALGIFHKKLRRTIKRGVKRLGRQAKRLGKKVARTYVRVATLGLSDFQRAVTRTKRQLRRCRAQLRTETDPVKRAAIRANCARLTRKLQKKRRNRRRVIKAAAIAGAVVAGPAALGALKGIAASAGPFLKGALALGKSSAFTKIAGFLAKSGLQKYQAEQMAKTMVEYPPDLGLMDPQAMFADSLQRQQNAREQPPITKALPWLGAGAAALLALFV